MDENLLEQMVETLRRRRIRRRWYRVVSFIAILVVFVTTYVLILPAITQEQDYVCGYIEHTHTESCYDGETLICEDEEHVHTYYCLEDYLTSDEYRINRAIELIAALPTVDEVEQKLAEYEDAGDDAGYEAYYKQVNALCLDAYAYYEDLGPELRESVANVDLLMDLQWIWSRVTFPGETTTRTIHAINQYTASATGNIILIYGRSVSSISGMSFLYWDLVIVEPNSSGTMVVSQVISSDSVKKGSYQASSDGYMLLCWGELTPTVGQKATLSFDYTDYSTAAYKSSGYGTVTFGDAAELKPDKDNTDLLHPVETADTKDFITINLYDYGDNINDVYLSDKSYPGFQQEYGTTIVASTFNGGSFNFGNNITADLNAGISGFTSSTTSGINSMNSTDVGNMPTENAMLSTLGDDGYPALANGNSLKYLFSDNTYAVKQNTDNINGLFQYNEETGEYTFNSRENHAQFEPSTNTFTVYKERFTPNMLMYPFGNFMPLNDIVHDSKQASTIDRDYFLTIAESAQYKQDEGYSVYDDEYQLLSDVLYDFVERMDSTEGNTSWTGVDGLNNYFDVSGIDKSFTASDVDDLYSLDYDEPSDFYFGMEIKMDFIQPKDGLTGINGDQPMKFYFTGDDDVWIYIDDVLFLDLSGIHRHVGGMIDFVNGVVEYYALDIEKGDVSDTAYKTYTFEELLGTTDGLSETGTFEDYSVHSFNFYYMERGSGSGICRMNFNLTLTHENSISVAKELTVDDESVLPLLGNPDFKFQILKSGTEEFFVAPGTVYTVKDSAGNTLRESTVDDDGVFRIKAGEIAVFSGIADDSGNYYVRELLEDDVFGQYGTITVDGTMVNTSNDILVGTDSFVGLDGPVKDIYSGSTVFRFDNNLEVDKLGSLKITKHITAYSEIDSSEMFEFHVTLDGTPLEVGTLYKVYSGDEFLREEVVVEDGQIFLFAEESALIEEIIAGTVFEVQEVGEALDKYNVIYGGEKVTTDGTVAEGMIVAIQPVEVTVSNMERGATVEIPGIKTLNNYDGDEYTYRFSLEQVTDYSGKTLVENGLTQETSSTFVSGLEGSTQESAFKFILGYGEKSFTEESAVFYYKITEVIPDSTDTVFTTYDESYYVAEVTVTKTADTMTAELTALWKNGSSIAPVDETTTLDFDNSLVSDLTVVKKISGDGVSADTEFNFTLSLILNDEPLSGTYTVYKISADGSEKTPSEITLTDGKALFSIKADETIVIEDLPVGTVWSVTETTGGYHVIYQINSDPSQEGLVSTATVKTGENKVVYTNYLSYELPATGGNSMQIYIFGGMLLIMSVILLLYIKPTRKEGKRHL